MKALVILLSLLPLDQTGYVIEGENVVFFYEGEARSVVVSGNFNKWAKDDPSWMMKFDEQTKKWKLTVPKKAIRSETGSFYEFTYRVDGVLVDADKIDKRVIHCQGYGYRYVIRGI